MGKLMKSFLVVIFCAAAFIGLNVGTAQASFFTWNLNNPNGDTPSPHAYADTTNSFFLTAYGYVVQNGPASTTVNVSTWGPGGSFTNNTGTVTSHDLYGKNGGVGETGLGLNNLLSDEEIQFKSFVQLDVTNLYAHGLTDLTMDIGSIQYKEGYFLWGSNTLGTPGLLLKTGLGTGSSDVQNLAVPGFGTYKYYSVSATPIASGYSSSDVLILDAVAKSCPTVPEPASLSLLALGLGGLLFKRKKIIA